MIGRLPCFLALCCLSVCGVNRADLLASGEMLRCSPAHVVILGICFGFVKLRRVALYSSRAESCLPGCQLGANPIVVSIRVSAEVLASIGSGLSVQGCLRRHSRQSFIASWLSDWNLEPQVQRSRITHLARLCRLRLLCRVVGR